MQLRQPSPPDALVSFSDFLLEKFGLVATMQVAIIASIAFHTVAIVGLGFRLPSVLRDAAPHNVLEVVLVNARHAARPQKADALAQANLEGGGNTDKKMRAATPFPAAEPRQPSPELKAAEERVKQLEAESRELMLQLQAKAAVAPVQQQQEAREIVERNLEIERLEAQIRREHRAYQERPRKKFIGARAAEYRFAQYEEDWRAKVERVGTLNYPPEARGKLYGSLRLTVTVRP